MVGKIHKVLFLKPRWWLRHWPDWTSVKAFAPYMLTGSKDGKDDTLLRIVVDTFAAAGIAFQPATDFAPELLVKSGQVAGRPLSARQQRDVEFGWQLAKQMGRLDVGQTVCVKNQMVIAIEAIEGTDLCIQRRPAVQASWFHGRQSGKAATGHAFRRTHGWCENIGVDFRSGR